MIQRRENKSGLSADEVHRLQRVLEESRRARRESIERNGLGRAEGDVRLEAQAAREFGELSRLNEALARLDGGDYGLCAMCGGAIGVDRLERSPADPFCDDCQEEAEAA